MWNLLKQIEIGVFAVAMMFSVVVTGVVGLLLDFQKGEYFVAIFLCVTFILSIFFTYLVKKFDENEALELEEKYPKVATYKAQNPEEYQMLFDQDPTAFIHYCPKCGQPVRVCSSWVPSGVFDPISGKQTQEALVISCNKAIYQIIPDIEAEGSTHFYHIFVRDIAPKA